MKRRIIYAAAVLFTTLSIFNLFSQELVTVEKGQKIGTVSKTKGSKDINVIYPASAASKVKMGSKLYVVTEKDGQPVIVELDVTFPMMTQTKVKIAKSSANYAGLISDKADVFLSAKLVKEEKVITLPEDNEVSMKIREYIAESIVSDNTPYVEKCNELKTPGKTFLKPGFTEPWSKFIQRCVTITDKNNNVKFIEMASGQMDRILRPINYFGYAALEQVKAKTTDTRTPAVEVTEEDAGAKILGLPLVKNNEGFAHYDPKALDILGGMMYPRNGMFGNYSAKGLYYRYSYHLRYLARLAVKCDKDKVLHKKLVDSLISENYDENREDVYTVIKKAKLPAIHSSIRGTVTHQVVSFYVRRSVDGTMPVLLKYMWIAFKDFDPDFYNQPDIKAFGTKISSMQITE